MKIKIFIVWLICICATSARAQHTLEVTIVNIQESNGDIYLGVYNTKDGFPEQEKTFKNTIVQAEKGSVTITLNLPSGDYGISVYHDANRNGKLDKNMFGAPTEYYGFSNNARSLFSAPSFDACKVTLPSTQTITIDLH